MSYDDAGARALALDVLTEFVEAAAMRPAPKVRRRWWWKPDGGSTSGRYAYLESHALVHPTPRHWCAVCNTRGGRKEHFQKRHRLSPGAQLLLFDVADAAE